MKEVQEVTIESSKFNSYSQVMRGCISAMDACTRLGNQEKLYDFTVLLRWASKMHEQECSSAAAKH